MKNRIIRPSNTIIRIGGGPPECPLCEKKMREVLTKKAIFYVCTGPDCMISINKNDPCVGKWRDAQVPCYICKKPMRLFFKSNGFLKAQCRDTSHRMFQVMRGHVEELPPEFRKPL